MSNWFSSFDEQLTYELNDSFDTHEEYSDDDDPDWVKTPLVREKRKTTISRSLLGVKPMNPPPNKSMNQSKNPPKRSKNGCSCKTGCKEGSCGCRKNANSCLDSCRCATLDNCTNCFGATNTDRKRSRSTDNSNMNIDEEDKENFDDEVPATPEKKLR